MTKGSPSYRRGRNLRKGSKESPDNLLFNKLISLSAKKRDRMSQKERFLSFAGKTGSTLSHEIFELLLQLRILVVDAPHDGMLEGAANQGSQASSIPALQSCQW